MRSIPRRVRQLNISCTSMVVTVFGDVVSQHGGRIWLGSLIQALEPLGFNERAVRTAAYRLVQGDWLRVERIGRRSFYAFTPRARGHYERAARRIYAPKPGDWDGNWTLVAPVHVPNGKRDALRKSLLWQGFNTLLPGMYAHPSSDRVSLDESLRELGLTGKAVVFNARTDDEFAQSTLRELVWERWDLDGLRDQYRAFVAHYGPRLQRATPEPEEAFQLRVLQIHEYRRMLLRDAGLPRDMLPRDWAGFAAHDLLRALYTRLAEPSMAYVCAHLENAEGPLPPASASFWQRLGGLPHKGARARQATAR